jgi:hypothetical protein
MAYGGLLGAIDFFKGVEGFLENQTGLWMEAFLDRPREVGHLHVSAVVRLSGNLGAYKPPTRRPSAEAAITFPGLQSP